MAGSGRVSLMRTPSQLCAQVYYCLTRDETRCESPHARVLSHLTGAWPLTSTSASSKVRVGKILVDRISLDEMLRLVKMALESRIPRTILNANANAVTLAQAHQSFAGAMAKADVIFCDGYGVYLAAQVLGAAIPERFTYADINEKLARVCHSAGGSLFLLGAKDGVAARAARNLEAAVPGLRVYSHHGYFPKDDQSSREVIDILNRSGASMLFVGFGMPLQELWITKYRAELEAIVVLSVGAALDYAAGVVSRGPRLLTQHGFEWLARLAIEPRRLWRRYLLGLPEFGLLVARQWMSQRLQLRGES
jgi:N-acetylglucosaminyldiphosphoundecaprenol N-acetyl-beta-D-mannosaminyltransferase